LDDKTRTELALFKFSLIAPLVNGSTEGSVKDYVERVCAKKYDVPGLGQREFSPHTVRSWYWAYRKYGLDGLKVKRRKDRGQNRSLSQEAANFIMESLKASPGRPVTAIYEDLVRSGIQSPPCSRSTAARFVKNLEVPLEEPAVERKRYELPFANDCWQSDILIGPYLSVDGKKKRTYLIAFLDDCSRLCLHAEFSFEETYLFVETAFKRALLKRGIPKKVFMDNGKVFRSLQMRIISAKMGVILSFTRPYSPASKGKIERFLRTLREQFIDQLEVQEICLDELNRLLEVYVENTYNQRPHSGLKGLTPIDRYLMDKDHLRWICKEELDRIFLHEVARRVTKDATISVNNTVFEVPQAFIGRQVKVFCRPDDLSSVHVQPHEGTPWVKVFPIRIVDNSQIPRKQNRKETIEYSRLFEEV